ncbi:unnamed protein product [Phytophthora fragariaefolia]|uniref:Unnamed protein product n=1 Tax=Phytophthora fragariaefolia TaxID=1490495 RepID=A0A9W7CG23_9STRA|nr:unnamed protein product [Phytophthora fragariaefolia]
MHPAAECNTRAIPPTLREQAAKFAELQHENFNLKMRVSYLEDKLLRLASGVTAFASEELEAEVVHLRGMLDEREHQLTEQNASMVRATQAIDELTKQLREAQAKMPQEGAQVGAGSVGHFSVAQVKAAQTAQHRIYELEEEVEALTLKLQEWQSVHKRDTNTSKQRKQHYMQTLQYLKRESFRACKEVEHLRNLNNSKDEMLARSRELLEDARQQKQRQSYEYSVRLKAFIEEVKQLGEQEERLHASYQADYARLERNWLSDETGLLAQNEFFREEIASLRR